MFVSLATTFGGWNDYRNLRHTSANVIWSRANLRERIPSITVVFKRGPETLRRRLKRRFLENSLHAPKPLESTIFSCKISFYNLAFASPLIFTYSFEHFTFITHGCCIVTSTWNISIWALGSVLTGSVSSKAEKLEKKL